MASWAHCGEIKAPTDRWSPVLISVVMASREYLLMTLQVPVPDHCRLTYSWSHLPHCGAPFPLLHLLTLGILLGRS